MEQGVLERDFTEALVVDRPSADFVRKVAELLETDAEDLLSELGYAGPQLMEAA
jgi:hypothetical protein